MLNAIAGVLRDKTAPPGQLVDVGGFKLHLHCCGPHNAYPTVVIEGGSGCAAPVYQRLQQTLAGRLRVCTYDRAGLGWSEESHQPRDAQHMVTQLHTLLQRAGLEGPYIFVGHSLAGLLLRLYAGSYPHDVAAMVLLDAAHPKTFEVQNKQAFTKRDSIVGKIMTLGAQLGLTRLYNPLFNINDRHLGPLPDEAKQQLLYLSHRPQSYRTFFRELSDFNASAAQAAEVTDLGNIPIVAITATSPDDLPDNMDKEKFIADKITLQKELAALSSNGRQISLAMAGHFTLVTSRQCADRVADEILRLAGAMPAG